MQRWHCPRRCRRRARCLSRRCGRRRRRQRCTTMAVCVAAVRITFCHFITMSIDDGAGAGAVGGTVNATT